MKEYQTGLDDYARFPDFQKLRVVVYLYNKRRELKKKKSTEKQPELTTFI